MEIMITTLHETMGRTNGSICHDCVEHGKLDREYFCHANNMICSTLRCTVISVIYTRYIGLRIFDQRSTVIIISMHILPTSVLPTFKKIITDGTTWLVEKINLFRIDPPGPAV